MSMTDPIGDMLTRIRNGQRAGKSSVLSPASKMRERVLQVLEREGFIRGYSRADFERGKAELSIELKYHEGQPVIQQIKRVSNGLGISILSTPRGVMSDNEAREANVGGEVLCTIF